MQPRDFIAGFIDAHEGGLSMHPNDNGNWYDPARYRANLKQLRGAGIIVGSTFGVTAYSINAARGTVLGAPAMKAAVAALTREQAIAIGMQLFYAAPGFASVPWNRVTASILDKAWGSGPLRAVKMLQKLLGVLPDGQLGPITAATYRAWLTQHGEAEAAALWADARIAFDAGLASDEGPNDPDRVFLNGWNNRTRTFLPGSAWWKSWDRKAA